MSCIMTSVLISHSEQGRTEQRPNIGRYKPIKDLHPVRSARPLTPGDVLSLHQDLLGVGPRETTQEGSRGGQAACI